MTRFTLTASTFAMAFALAACQNTSTTPTTTGSGTQKTITPAPSKSDSTRTATVNASSTNTELDALLAAAKRGDLTAQGTIPEPKFYTEVKDGRLWVFEQGTKSLEEFKASGEPAKCVTRPGAGPGGMTIRSDDASTINSYLSALKAGKVKAPALPTPEEVTSAAPARIDVASDPAYSKPGYFAKLDKNGRLWVFKEGSAGLKEFLESGEPAKHITRIAAGPDGKTVRSDDAGTIDAYLALWPKAPAANPYAKPGFHTEVDKNGRLWVFREGSDDLKEFQASGEPAKQVVRPGAGPGGITIKSSDVETINAYLGIDPQK